MKRFGIILWIAGCLALAPAATAEEIRWKLAEGEQLDVTLNQKSESTAVCQTIERKTSTEIQLELEWKVTAAKDDLITLEQTIRRIQMRLQTPTADRSGQVDLDTSAISEKKPRPGVEKSVLKDLQSLIGVKAIVEMTTRGEISNVTVAESDLEKLRQAGSSTPLLKMMSAFGMTELFRQSSFVLPEKSAEAGFEWTNERKTAGPFGPLAINETFRYDGEKEVDGRKLQLFSLKSKVDVLPELPKDADPVDPPPELKQLTGDGLFSFDPGTGVFSKSSNSTTLKSTKRFRDLIIDTTITTNSSMSIQRR
jgi:hypothetical protein